MGKISVVINTLNEEENLPRAIASVKSFADELVVVDMHSTDSTVEIAKKAGAVVFDHEKTGYVEPARNYAIGKATGDWILILDADEEVSSSLEKKLLEIVKDPKADYFRLPRKNMVFGKWIKNSRWWPDYNIRFFKKGTVTWNELIHSVPLTTGDGADLADDEKYALVHHNYTTIGKYIERMNRYTDVQSRGLIKNGYKFVWWDVISKPLGEFLSRYFVGEGFRDGLHGLVLALLQAFSEMIVVLKVWEDEGFKEQQVTLSQFEKRLAVAHDEYRWWSMEMMIRKLGFIKSLPLKLYRKVTIKNEQS